MTPDPLQELWTLQETTRKETVMNSIQLILDEDKACRKREHRANLRVAPVHLVLLPILLWFAAIAKTPLVREGYALMAAGVAIGLSVSWLFASWSRQALPGPVDTRSQLQKAAFLLSREASLARASFLWTAPVLSGRRSDWAVGLPGTRTLAWVYCMGAGGVLLAVFVAELDEKSKSS